MVDDRIQSLGGEKRYTLEKASSIHYLQMPHPIVPRSFDFDGY